jgi:hypothetical protein
MALSASATVAPARLSPAIGFPSMHIVALDVLGSGDADHNDVRGYFPTAREQLKDKVPQGGAVWTQRKSMRSTARPATGRGCRARRVHLTYENSRQTSMNVSSIGDARQESDAALGRCL